MPNAAQNLVDAIQGIAHLELAQLLHIAGRAENLVK